MLEATDCGSRRPIAHCYPSAAAANPRIRTPRRPDLNVQVALASGVEMAVPSILPHANGEEGAKEGSARSRSALTSLRAISGGTNCLVPVPSAHPRRCGHRQWDKVGLSTSLPSLARVYVLSFTKFVAILGHASIS